MTKDTAEQLWVDKRSNCDALILNQGKNPKLRFSSYFHINRLRVILG